MSLDRYTVTDTFKFRKEIRDLKINTGEILVSYDVSSLFPNVPLDETIEILADRTLKDHWFNTTYDLNLIGTDLVDLLGVATKGNFFGSMELYTNRLMTLLWGSHSSLC